MKIDKKALEISEIIRHIFREKSHIIKNLIKSFLISFLVFLTSLLVINDYSVMVTEIELELDLIIDETNEKIIKSKEKTEKTKALKTMQNEIISKNCLDKKCDFFIHKSGSKMKVIQYRFGQDIPPYITNSTKLKEFFSDSSSKVNITISNEPIVFTKSELAFENSLLFFLLFFSIINIISKREVD